MPEHDYDDADAPNLLIHLMAQKRDDQGHGVREQMLAAIGASASSKA